MLETLSVFQWSILALKAFRRFIQIVTILSVAMMLV